MPEISENKSIESEESSLEEETESSARDEEEPLPETHILVYEWLQDEEIEDLYTYEPLSMPGDAEKTKMHPFNH